MRNVASPTRCWVLVSADVPAGPRACARACTPAAPHRVTVSQLHLWGLDLETPPATYLNGGRGLLGRSGWAVAAQRDTGEREPWVPLLRVGGRRPRGAQRGRTPGARSAQQTGRGSSSSPHAPLRPPDPP